MSAPSCPCICVLSGIPAAGKTSLTRALVQEFQQQQQPPAAPSLNVCFDEIYEARLKPPASASSFSPDDWQAARQEAQRRTSTFLQECSSSSPTTPGFVLVDDNMHYRSMRFEYFRVAQRASASFVQLHVHCATDEARRRNAQRSGFARVPEASFDRLLEQFEAPDPQRFFFERQTLSPDTSTSLPDPAELLDRIRELWKLGPAPALPDSELLETRRRLARITTQSSLVHQLDLHTRKALGSLVLELSQRHPGLDQAALAKRLNEARRQVLEAARKDVKRGGDLQTDSELEEDFDTLFRRLAGAFDAALQAESRQAL